MNILRELSFCIGGELKKHGVMRSTITDTWGSGDSSGWQNTQSHSEKCLARSMLFYSTNCWQQN